MAFREFFSVRVECEYNVMHLPDLKREFDEWCLRRIIRECGDRGYEFTEYEYLTELLSRDPEGPGRGVQPMRLILGYRFPELEPIT